MTGEELQHAIRAFERRRLFRSYFIEFVNGERLTISHPETLERYGELFHQQQPDHSHHIFAAAHVCRLYDEHQNLPLD